MPTLAAFRRLKWVAAFRRSKRAALDGHVDGPVDGSSVPRGEVVVQGWHSWNGIPVAAVAVEAAGVTVVASPGIEPRPDVAEARGDPALLDSGWRAVLDLTDAEGDTRVAVIAVTVWGSPDSRPMRLPPIQVTLSDEPTRRAAGDVVGFLDSPAEGERVESHVKVSGWAVASETAVSKVEILVNGRSFGRARLGISRMDLAPAFSEPHAVISGFEHLLELSEIPPGRARVVVRAWAGRVGPIEVADQWFEVASTGDAADASRQSNHASAQRGAIVAARRRRLVQAAARASGGELSLAVMTHSLKLGGAELWLKELLVRCGAGRTFPCRVLSLNDGPLVNDLESAGMEVHVTQGELPPDSESFEGRVTEAAMWLAAGGHNAALVNTVVPWFGAEAAFQLGIPTVWAIHESWRLDELWCSLFASYSVAPEVRSTLAPALRRAQALVFVAEATRRLYLGSVGAERTIVVPYGIDVDEINAFCSTMTRDEARVALSIAPGTRMILAVGEVQPRKAQTVLATAFADVADEFPHSVLAIVGDGGGSYTEALLEYLQRRGLSERVRVVPVTDDTSVWYRAADAFICGSDNESMPRAILEALAFGLPVAATEVFGIPDLLTDGETGFLFDARDKDAAVHALRRLLGSQKALLSQVAAAGHRLAIESLDSSGYTRDVMALLEGLRADPTARPSDILARSAPRPFADRLADQLPRPGPYLGRSVDPDGPHRVGSSSSQLSPRSQL